MHAAATPPATRNTKQTHPTPKPTQTSKAEAGVTAVSVSLEGGMAAVEVEAGSLMDALERLPGLVAVVQGLGFEAEPHIEYEPSG